MFDALFFVVLGFFVWLHPCRWPPFLSPFCGLHACGRLVSDFALQSCCPHSRSRCHPPCLLLPRQNRPPHHILGGWPTT